MAQVQNVPQTIADTLFNKWGLDDPAELKKDKIDFAAFSYHPDQRFKQGKDIVIEIDNPSGTADPRTLSLTMIQDLFKLDVWIKLKDSSREARIRAENNRALIKDQILKIIHDNQTSIIGIDIGTFGRFLKQDELENNILHNTIFVVGEWRHKQSE
jgi:hypothetical protein